MTTPGNNAKIAADRLAFLNGNVIEESPDDTERNANFETHSIIDE